MVASSPHIRGRAKSAIRPRTIKIIQKIFFSTIDSVSLLQARFESLHLGDSLNAMIG
jgi:hypothetical protein